MNTILIATLKEGWHNNLPNLSEKAHDILEDVDKIWFYNCDSIAEAEETIDSEGYYVYLPPRWDNDFDLADNYNALSEFCGLIRDLQLKAYPLMVDKSDIESFSSYTISENLYNAFCNVDFDNIRINDVPALIKMTNLVL